MDANSDFISEFNEYYPFERYIMKTPVSINYLFDDVKLTELFIPSTEIKPVVDEETKEFLYNTSVNNDEIYIKLKCKDVEFRLALFDLDEQIVNDITFYVRDDFGAMEWQDLYVENEDFEDLKEALETQRELIVKKYGDCKIKDNFIITDTLNLLNGNENE